jgi:Flp pilus assembly protein TadB
MALAGYSPLNPDLMSNLWTGRRHRLAVITARQVLGFFTIRRIVAIEI